MIEALESTSTSGTQKESFKNKNYLNLTIIK